jgi:hypothetical protein
MADPEYTLNRITLDLLTEEPISQRRLDSMAREATENLHLLIVEKEDAAVVKIDKNIEAHVHATSTGDRCPNCLEHSLDYKSGESVAEEAGLL